MLKKSIIASNLVVAITCLIQINNIDLLKLTTNTGMYLGALLLLAIINTFSMLLLIDSIRIDIVMPRFPEPEPKKIEKIEQPKLEIPKVETVKAPAVRKPRVVKGS
jgi:hypothetical protein